jgi:hypothetical protein
MLTGLTTDVLIGAKIHRFTPAPPKSVLRYSDAGASAYILAQAQTFVAIREHRIVV